MAAPRRHYDASAAFGGSPSFGAPADTVCQQRVIKVQIPREERLSSATGPFRGAYGAMLSATKAFLADGDTTGYAATAKDLPDLNARFG